MVDLIVVISSEFSPLPSTKYEKKISQYTLKLCHIINNISIKVYITIPYASERKFLIEIYGNIGSMPECNHVI